MKIKKHEYIERMALLQKSVHDNRLDAFLVTSQDSIYYLTGVTYAPLERPFFILVRSKRPPILLAPSLDREHLSSAPNVDELRSYWDYPSPKGMGWPEKLNEMLKGNKKLGVEPALTQEIAVTLSAFKPKVIPLVENLRLIKSADEIAMIRQAAHYADIGMSKIISTSYFGVSELEVFSQSRTVQIKIIKETEFDALNTSVLTAVWPARLCTQPHGVPDAADRMKEGPHIALSFLRVNGYAAECERTFFVSRPSRKMKEMFEIMLESRKRAFALVRPGVSCSEIDIAANGFLREQGLGDYLLHRTGHGLGLGNHEGPWVADGSSDILKAGMMISIEPGIYIKALGGFRHSDSVLVTPDGYECLTKYPTDLNSLTQLSAKIFTRLRGALIRKAVGI